MPDAFRSLSTGAKANSIELAEEASKRFGKDRILVSVENVDFVFKHQAKMNENFHELLVLNTGGSGCN